ATIVTLFPRLKYCRSADRSIWMAQSANGRPANEFKGCFDAPSAISAKNWQGHDHRGCRSDCGCNHHVAVAVFFDRAIGRCQAAVGRTPPNGGESFTLPVFWQLEFLVSSLGRSSGR